ncbi:helix-turn-helix domain-containing protein [Paucilactobacillus sp. N302-9]
MTLVERIKEVAKKRGWNLKTTADKAGIGINSIYRWKDQTPTADSLSKVAKVLDVSVDYLLGNEEPKEDVNDYFRIDISKIDPSKRDEFIKDLEKYSKFLEDNLDSDDPGDRF